MKIEMLNGMVDLLHRNYYRKINKNKAKVIVSTKNWQEEPVVINLDTGKVDEVKGILLRK